MDYSVVGESSVFVCYQDAVVHGIDDVARRRTGSSCQAADDDVNAGTDVNPTIVGAEGGRSRGIDAQIIALNHRPVGAVVDQRYEPADGSGDHYVARASRSATDHIATRTLVHLDRRTVTHHSCAVCIHANEISCHKIVIATHEDECVMHVSGTG